MLKKSLVVALAVVGGGALPAVSFAQDNPLSFNVGAVTDYRYRGISQTRLKPALQGGVDYALTGGFYIGAWASTIKWIKDAGGDANVETDFYGGYKGQINKDVGFDVGVLRYQYFNHDLTTSPNTTELYGALTFGPATLKYSHSVTNLFGFTDSKNSSYLDLTATFDVGSGVSLAPHVGHQRVANNSTFSYTDYSLTASKDFHGFGVSLALVATDTKDIPGSYPYVSPNGRNLGRTTVVLGVKKTF